MRWVWGEVRVCQRRRAFLLVMVSATLGVPASGASAASWSLQSVPQGLVFTGHLSAVSCSSLNSCVAVGHTFSTTGKTIALAESWNGSAWKLQSVPLPSGTTSGQLSGVACTSGGSCTAVGAANQQPFAVGLQSGVWSIEAPVLPAGASTATLNGVACTAASSCVAVGSSTDSSAVRTALIERSSGSGWTIDSTPSRPVSELNGVACVSAQLCTAVGHSGSEPSTLAERWDGTAWTVQATADPTRPAASRLLSIACTSASACTAVGRYNLLATDGVTYGPDVRLLERFDGTSWRIRGTPNPTGARTSILNSVACVSSTLCDAVGNTNDEQGPPLDEHLVGSSWSLPNVPLPSDATRVSLEGVYCTSRASCLAVGAYSTTTEPSDPGAVNHVLAEHWNGTAWTQSPARNAGGSFGSALYGGSCTSDGGCQAVGYVESFEGQAVPMADRWTGTSWVRETPAPGSARSTVLTDVACESVSSCTAVGTGYPSRGSPAPVAERLSGTAWSLQLPPPAGSSGTTLDHVACASQSSCFAVGTASVRSLLEHYDGTSWSIVSPPSPANASHIGLAPVGCSAAAGCMLVGDWTDNSGATHPLAEHFDGTSWTVLSPPGYGTGDSGFLDASCASDGTCMALGWSRANSSAPTEYFSETWSGSGWTTHAVPNAPNASRTEPAKISCASSSACALVGISNADPPANNWVPLAEYWDGTSWVVTSTPKPSSAIEAHLDGVSCTASRVCTAFGYYFTHSGIVLPLVERYS